MCLTLNELGFYFISETSLKISRAGDGRKKNTQQMAERNALICFKVCGSLLPTVVVIKENGLIFFCIEKAHFYF